MNCPPGMIGLACGDTGRFSDFAVALRALHVPNGSMFRKSAGLGPANPFNDIGQQFMERPELKWLFLINDDNLWQPDVIYRLWERNVDVVSGLYFSKIMPFEPIAFTGMTTNTGARWYHRFFPVKGDHGIVPIVACGDGCLLIRRHVMTSIEAPWWEYGETLSDACDHDMVFSRKVREAGYSIWLDLDVPVDHIGIFTVRPHRKENGEWVVRIMQAGDRYIEVPAADPAMNK